eukprot:2284550-Amphidinium_carterae.2
MTQPRLMPRSLVAHAVLASARRAACESTSQRATGEVVPAAPKEEAEGICPPIYYQEQEVPPIPGTSAFLTPQNGVPDPTQNGRLADCYPN